MKKIFQNFFRPSSLAGAAFLSSATFALVSFSTLPLVLGQDSFVSQLEQEGAVDVSRLVERVLEAPSDALALGPTELEKLRAVPDFLPTLKTVLLNRTQEVLLRDGPAESTWLVRIARVFFPESDPLIESIQRKLEAVESAEHLAATGDTKALRDLVRLSQDAGDQGLIAARFLRAVHKNAESELEKGRPAEALMQLEIVPKDLLTEKTKDLLSRSVVRWQEDLTRTPFDTKPSRWPLSEKAARDLIDFVAEADAGVLFAVTEIYEWQSLAAVATNELKTAADAYAEVLRRRPDPDEQNNDLRMQVASLARGTPMESFAKGRIEELKSLGALTPTRKIKLLLWGYYGRMFLGLLLLCLGILCAVPLLAKIQPRWLFRQIPVPSFRRPSFTLPKIEREKKKLPGYLSPAESNDEYSELLELFGLDDSSSEDDIKTAYRSAIKMYHPDHVNPNDPQKEEIGDRFRRMQRAYERIMEIRGAWFGGGR